MVRWEVVDVENALAGLRVPLEVLQEAVQEGNGDSEHQDPQRAKNCRSRQYQRESVLTSWF
jgi:hypothetical protein